MKTWGVARVLVPGLLVAGMAASLPAGAAPAPSYIGRLEAHVRVWRLVMPTIQNWADRAALGATRGGHVYVLGPPTSFAAEALGRAGGMMMVQPYRPDLTLGHDDTVLASCIGKVPEELAQLYQKQAREGFVVVLFQDGAAATVDDGARPFAVLTTGLASAAERAVPGLVSTSNVIGLWAFTGELVAACVRRGKMPTFYESYWLPGGRERDEAIAGPPFHPATDVTPESVKGLGTRYLDVVAAALRRLREANRGAFPKAAALLRSAHAAGHRVCVLPTSHMFPSEMQNGATPDWFAPIGKAEEAGTGDAVLVLGYQPFPWKDLPVLTANGRPCVVTSARRALPPFERDPKHVYLDPCWSTEDAAVRLDGYDIPILPLSGVMQCAVYWQLVELVARR